MLRLDIKCFKVGKVVFFCIWQLCGETMTNETYTSIWLSLEATSGNGVLQLFFSKVNLVAPMRFQLHLTFIKD